MRELVGRRFVYFYVYNGVFAILYDIYNIKGILWSICNIFFMWIINNAEGVFCGFSIYHFASCQAIVYCRNVNVRIFYYFLLLNIADLQLMAPTYDSCMGTYIFPAEANMYLKYCVLEDTNVK